MPLQDCTQATAPPHRLAVIIRPKSCATARLSPKHQIFWFGFCTQSNNTRAASTHGQQNHSLAVHRNCFSVGKTCTIRISCLTLLPVAVRCGGLCSLCFVCVEATRNTAQAASSPSDRIIGVFIVWESATLFHLTKPNRPPYYCNHLGTEFHFLFPYKSAQ